MSSVGLTKSDYYPFGMIMPERKYSANTTKYRYSINGQEKDIELNENITTAEYWEYDSRIGRRWNVDPKPTVGSSPYCVFSSNPIFYVDRMGDTSGVYARYLDPKTNTPKTELLFQTTAKGKNTAVILNPEQSKAFVSDRSKIAKVQNYLKANANNDKVQNSMEALFNSSKYDSDIYDTHAAEQFQDQHVTKGKITKISGGIIETASNIKINGKDATHAQLVKYVSSLGVGPEYIASMVKQDGVYVPGRDITTDNDLVSAQALGRIAHIHNHMPVALATISFDYIEEGVAKHTSTGNPLPKNYGPSRSDRSVSNYSPFSVMVNGEHVYLYTPRYDETIKFNRSTRKYQ